MANQYYKRTVFIPYGLARAEDVNLSEVSTEYAFDYLPNPISTSDKGFSENFKVKELPSLEEHVVRATDIQSSFLVFAEDSTATGNIYTVTLTPIPTAYTNGFKVVFKAAKTSTATAYLNVNGLGDIKIVRPNGEDTVGGDISYPNIHLVMYVDGNFQLLSYISTIIDEAPDDGKTYARKNGEWVEIST